MACKSGTMRSMRMQGVAGGDVSGSNVKQEDCGCGDLEDDDGKDDG